MNHPIKDLTKKEWGLWIGSIGTILTANILSGNMDILTIAPPTGGSSGGYCAMGETLTQQRRVKDEGLRIVNFFY